MAKPNGSLDEAFGDLVRAQPALTRAPADLLARQAETDRELIRAERRRTAFEQGVRQGFARIMHRMDDLEERLLGKTGFGKKP